MLKAAKDLEVATRLLDDYKVDSLSELKLLLSNMLPMKCPKCEGHGYYNLSVNVYPSGLPDSGWAFEQGWKRKTCDVCNGDGYTKEEVFVITECINGEVGPVIGFVNKDKSKRWNAREKDSKIPTSSLQKFNS